MEEGEVDYRYIPYCPECSPTLVLMETKHQLFGVYVECPVCGYRTSTWPPEKEVEDG